MPNIQRPQGAVVASVGGVPNTGSLEWVMPRVPAGIYYFLIRPLSGQRRFEVRIVNLGSTGSNRLAMGSFFGR